MFFPVFPILSKIETLQYFVVVVFELHKLALKFIWECKKSRIAKIFLKNIKVMINKTVSYWCKDRQIHQWKRIQSPETDPQEHKHLTYNRGGILQNSGGKHSLTSDN